MHDVDGRKIHSLITKLAEPITMEEARSSCPVDLDANTSRRWPLAGVAAAMLVGAVGAAAVLSTGSSPDRVKTTSSATTPADTRAVTSVTTHASADTDVSEPCAELAAQLDEELTSGELNSLIDYLRSTRAPGTGPSASSSACDGIALSDAEIEDLVQYLRSLHTSETTPDTSLALEQTGDVASLGLRETSLGDDEWVLLKPQPASFRFLWAKREGSSRTAMYGDDFGNTINVHVSTDRTEGPTAPTVDVGGHMWFIDQTQPGFVLAARFVGDSYVSLSANGASTPDEVTGLLGTLVTVDNDAVPGDLLAPTDDKFHDVATFGLLNDTIVMSAYEVNEKFCTRWKSSDLASGGCVETLDVNGVMSSALAAYSQHELGSSTERVVAHGIVHADVERVTVTLADGQHFDLTPTDTSGRFDVRFWLLAADIAPTEGPAVTHIAAYDARGAILAAQG